MQVATTRATAAGRVLGPAEALTPIEALRAYTTGAAAALGQERTRGAIAVGLLADLAVLDADPLAVPADRLGAIRPMATMLDGVWVHDRR